MEIDFKEVISFLRDNLNKEFDYTQVGSFSDNRLDECGCLMLQFFKERVNFKNSYVSANGWNYFDFHSNNSVRIINLPSNLHRVGQIHYVMTTEAEIVYKVTGRQILERCLELGFVTKEEV